MVGVPKSTGCLICRKRKISKSACSTMATTSNEKQSAVWPVPQNISILVLANSDFLQDETWPTCLNCQKNGKCCPGPPARHTFKDLGPSLITSASSVQTTKSNLAVSGTFIGVVTGRKSVY
jgi:hypothetical protein